MTTKAELHYLDINSTEYPCDTSGTVTCLNAVATGSTAVTRVGNKVMWNSVLVSGRLSAVSDAVVRSRCDVFLIWDRSPGAALPAMTDFFVQSISGSPRNLDNVERFTTVYHKSFSIGGSLAASAALTPTTHCVDMYQTLGRVTTYNGTGNALANISSGALYLVTIGDRGVGACGSLRCSVRCRFYEM